MLSSEFFVGHGTARRKRRGPHEEVVIDDAMVAGIVLGDDHLLAPDLRRVDIESKTNLFLQLSPMRAAYFQRKWTKRRPKFFESFSTRW